MSNQYTLDDIQIKSDISHIRERPGMYIGESMDPRHMLVEAIDNAVDEVINDSSTKIVVEVTQGTNSNTYSVRDTGRGIPIGYKVTPDGDSRVTTEAITLFGKSGGKFTNDAFKISGGLHGVGMNILAALSNTFEIVVNRDDKELTTLLVHPESMTDDLASSGLEFFQDDIYVKSEIVDKPTEVSGTLVTFSPRSEYFDSPRIPVEFIVEKCKVANAHTDQAVTLIVDGEVVDTSATFKDLSDINKDSTIYSDTMIEVEDEIGQGLVLWLAYTNDSKYLMTSLVNYIYTRDGGTHYNEIRKSIVNSWWKYVGANITDEMVDYEISRMRNDDVLVGVVGVTSLLVQNVSFAGQTKDRLTTASSHFQELLNKVEDQVYDHLASDPDRTLQLFLRAVEYRKSKDRLSDMRDLRRLIKVNDPEKGSGKTRRRSIVDKLKDCSSPDKEGTELLILEGDSASGPFQRVRDRSTQAILSLRGKIMNTSGMTAVEALKSQEVLNIINSVGAGAGDEDEANPELARYGKIIYIGDPDPDGLHITALVANVFISYLRPLVEAGMVYIMYPPLYNYVEGGVTKFTSDLEEVPERLRLKGEYVRYKGLGEMEDEEIHEVCILPENRNIYQLQYPENLESFQRILGTSAGRRDIALELGLLVKR